jgi:type VI secretion system protein ImpE
MSAIDSLKNANLAEALADLTAQVRKHPSDPRHRVFLFQLFCVLGEWKRAVTQLKVCAELDPMSTPMAQSYREAIICEMVREKVFAGEKDPLVFGQPQDWVALMTEALKAQVRGDVAAAAALRARAFDAAPASSGTIDGQRFEWIADADSRLGPLLELVMNGRYFWVPFDQIARIALDAPEDLRDSVWTPVRITWSNGGEVVGFIPTRYPGAPASTNDLIRLARLTEWQDLGHDTYIGAGQRLLATDTGDHALMDLREIVFDRAESTGSTEGDDDDDASGANRQEGDNG